MRIQFTSDLHLEERPKTTFETFLEHGRCPVLALLGDICPSTHPNFKPFLEWCSERWETILYVPGNVELFESNPAWSIAESLSHLIGVTSAYKNIHVLYRDKFMSSDGLLVLGCAFWSCIPDAPKSHRKRHLEDVEWVRAATKETTLPVLVLTHYGPTRWVQNELVLENPAKSPVNHEIEVLLRSPVLVWIFGHLHGYIEYTKTWNSADGAGSDVLLVSNGYGSHHRRDAILGIRVPSGVTPAGTS
jgi:hypothetical protein